jgi:hypothetical protein
MMNTPQEFEAAFHDLIAKTQRGLGDPPSDELLLSYHLGELEEDEAEQVREYLAYDRPTMDRFLTLTGEGLEAPPADFLTKEQMAAGKENIDRQLRRLERMVEVSRTRRTVERVLPLVAVIAFAVLGVLYQGKSREVERLGNKLAEPGLNQLSYKILPDGKRSRGGEVAYSIQVGASGAHVTWALFAPGDFESYRLSAYHQDVPLNAEPTWGTDGLELQQDGSLQMGLPQGLLPTGEYVFRIYGLREDGAPSLLEEYTVNLFWDSTSGTAVAE